MIGAIDVRELVDRPGASKTEQFAGTIEDLATELASVREDAPITGELVLEALSEGLLASGTIQGSLALRCARCLKDFERGFSVDVQELFVPFPHEDSDEYPLDPEGFLEPDQMLRDAIGVELPYAPACRPDCRGLCARCGGRPEPRRVHVPRAGHRSAMGRLGRAARRAERLEPRRVLIEPAPEKKGKMGWRFRRRNRASREVTSARRTGRRSRPPTPSVRSAISPSSRTASAATAATTPGARRSRSSDRVTEAPPLAGPDSLDAALGIRFRDEALRETALTHRSYAFEHGLDETNERLEFLGDSVLGLVVTDMAFASFPGKQEGELAKLRAAIVNAQALADVARSLGLGTLVRLGKGEEQSGGRDKASILADALEAVFGAVYLDLGLDEARRLIERLFRPLMEARGANATTRRTSRSSRRVSCARCPSTASRSAARTTRRSSRPRCTSVGRRSASGSAGRRRKPSNERPARRSTTCRTGTGQ